VKVQNLFNYQLKTQKNANNNPNFKSLSPAAKTKLVEVSSGPAKEAFVKLSAMAGLTGIVTFLHSCIDNEPTQEDKANLEILANNAKERANAYLTNPETIDLYLETSSSVDATEANIWTKGLASESKPVVIPQYSTESRQNILSSEYGESYLAQVSNRRLESILSQAKAISASGNYEELALSLDKNLSGLVKEADKLSKNEKVAEIYSRISDIVKMSAIANFIDSVLTKKNSEAEVVTEVEAVEEAPISPETQATQSDQEEILGKEEPKTDIVESEIASEEAVETFTQKVEEAVDYSAKDEVQLTGPSVLGKIDLGDTKGYLTRMREKEEANIYKEIVETEANKEFVKIFRQGFNPDSHIKPELYGDKIDFIQKIYDTYSGKEKMEKFLLKILSEEDSRKIVNLYYELTNGTPEKIDFLSFHKIQTNKHIYGGDLTKEEFDRLNEYKNSKIKYYGVQLYDKGANKVKMPFVIESSDSPDRLSAEEKLKTILDCYQIIFNVPDNSMISGATSDVYTEENVRTEIVDRIVYGKEGDYASILDFLEVDEGQMELINEEIKDKDLDEARIDLNNLLNSASLKFKMYELVDIINNKAFEGLIDGVHGRMRFLDRILFKEDKELIAKPKKAIKQVTTRQVNKLKTLIENYSDIVISDYGAKKKDGTITNKKGAQVVIELTDREYILGLNAKAQIHTILTKPKTQTGRIVK